MSCNNDISGPSHSSNRRQRHCGWRCSGDLAWVMSQPHNRAAISCISEIIRTVVPALDTWSGPSGDVNLPHTVGCCTRGTNT